MNILLFVCVVLCWGLTWFAIHVQIGPTPIDVAVFWRFTLATIMLFVALAATGRLRPVSRPAWNWLLLLGACIFSCNFIAIYSSEQFIPSGAVSVIFSMATVFNVANQWLFFGMRPDRRSLLGAAFGMSGVAMMAQGQGTLSGSGGQHVIAGIALALLGTFLFSLGNMVTRKVTPLAHDLPNAVLRGMLCGSAILGIIVTLHGHSFAMPSLAASSGRIWYAGLLYLALVGSVVGFLAYLSLAARIGADRAAYTTVISPVIALAVSSFFESANWSPMTLLGLAMILGGNIVVFARAPTFAGRVLRRTER